MHLVPALEVFGNLNLVFHNNPRILQHFPGKDHIKRRAHGAVALLHRLAVAGKGHFAVLDGGLRVGVGVAAGDEDVARLAGVSVATVSRVLCGQEEIVSQKTRQKVLDAANTLGYAPNMIARNLKVRRSNMIGLLIPNSSNPFFLQVMNILFSDMKQNGYNVIVSFCHENREDEYENFMSLLSARVEAILFTPVCRNEDILRQLKINKIYALQLNRRMYDELDAVLWDDVDGVHQAAVHLFDRGHTRLMLLGPIASREKGFRDAHKTRGIPLLAEQMVRTPDVGIDSEALRVALIRFQPQAIITVAHETTYSVLTLLKEQRLSIPGEVSMICYDDDELTRFLDLSVVAHDLEKQARIACNLLMQNLNAEAFSRPPIMQLMQTKLIERGSVADVKAKAASPAREGG